MKNLFLLLSALFVVAIVACSSESDPARTIPPAQPNESVSSDTLEYLDLSPEQYRDLDSADIRWYRAGYMEECASSGRFKMDCHDCESKSVGFTVHVNERGEIDRWLDIEPRVICRNHSAKAIQTAEDCLKANIKHLVLTTAFANRWVKLQIGHALGC